MTTGSDVSNGLGHSASSTDRAAWVPGLAGTTKKNGARRRRFENQFRKGLCRFGFLFLHRTRILALGVDVAVDELDHGHRGVVAVAEARLDDAGVATLAVLVAGRQRVEQISDHVDVAELRDR